MKEINVPDNFPIKWEKNEDRKKTWMQDEMHAASPIYPMGRHFFGSNMAEGYNQAFNTLHYPFKSEVKFFNTYYYLTMYPSVSPEEFCRQIPEAEAALDRFLSSFRKDWDEKYLPEILSHTTFMIHFDLQKASMTDLIEHFKESSNRFNRLWEIHFINVVPMMIAPSAFIDYFQELFPQESQFRALELLEGYNDMCVQLGIECWKLAQEAKKDKEIAHILKEHHPKAALEALQTSKSGWDFLAQIHELLKTYGIWRENIFDLTPKSWIDDLTQPIKTIQDFMTTKTANIEEHFKKSAEKREKLLNDVRKKLESFPKAFRERFEMLHHAAVTASVLQEDHNFYLDQTMIYAMHRILMEFGRRFVLAKVIDQPEDIMYLFPNELIEIVSKLPHKNVMQVIEDRKREMEHFRKITPPPIIGTEPQPLPAESALNKGIGKFFGGPVENSTEAHTFFGNPASPGIVRGPATIVNNTEETKKVEPGDILIAKTVPPSWSPLFGVAKGVVTNTGGILSHIAILAREYGIPAVLGVPSATAKIKDGDIVEINGETGTVNIIQTEP